MTPQTGQDPNAKQPLPVRLSRTASRLRAVLVSAAVLAAAVGCEAPRSAPSLQLQLVLPPAVPSETESETVVAEPVLSMSRRVELAGAINETVSFQFVLRARQASVPGVRFRVRPLRSSGARINASAVRIYRMHRVPVGKLPGWCVRTFSPRDRESAPYDVLVPHTAPRGGLPADLSAGEAYRFWVDVAIPKGSFEGLYAGAVELVSGSTVVESVDVRLRVLPLILPDVGDVEAIVELDHRALFRHHVTHRGRPVSLITDDWRDMPVGPELDALLRGTLDLLRRHRLTPVLPRLIPPVTIDARGRVSIDWRPYDAVVGPCMDGHMFTNRVRNRYWPIPVHGVLPSSQSDAWLSSPQRVELLRQYLSECAAHFAKKGWLARSYAIVPGVEQPNAQSIRTVRNFFAIAHDVDPRLTIATTLWPQDMAPYGWSDYVWTDFSEAVDLWLPRAQFFDRAVMEAERASGKQTWVTVDRPPYSGSISIFAPATFSRVLSWQTETLGAGVMFLGPVNHWPDVTGPATPERCAAFDPNTLIYPGTPFGLSEPVESVRLKHLRRGLEDAAYRRLLADRGLEHVAGAVAQALSRYAGTDGYRTHFADGRRIGFVEDPAMFRLAREILVGKLIGASSGVELSDSPGMARLSRSSAWRRLMPIARRLNVSIDGARLRLTGPRTDWSAELECSLTVDNGTRVPIEGTVAFASRLPSGWSASGETVPVGPIRPNRARRATLTAEVAGLPANPGGVVRLPVTLTTKRDDTVRRRVRLALITAVPFDGAVRIDGDLSDWPPGMANVASGFRSIVPVRADAQDEQAAQPQHETRAFVRRDDEYLYVAINSEFDRDAGRPTSRGNRIEYEDLVPKGDELVELLIDPLNAGTRTPGDLFHIAVKPSGSYVAERGIRFDPPCGLRSPWPVDLVVSTRVFDDRWTAEIRIPLAAFGVMGTEHAIWGFNVTRYDAAVQEFSTWSGAVGNAYDPLSLGNLYLP